MSTLNIVNKSPFEKLTLQQCLDRVGEGDSILLIEDACVGALAGTGISERLAQAGGVSDLYVLSTDLAARGHADASLVEGFKQVDYEGFVDLVVTHDRVHSWL